MSRLVVHEEAQHRLGGAVPSPAVAFLLSMIALPALFWLVMLKRTTGSTGPEEWLMANVIDDLLEAGAVVGEGQCFGYKTLPIMGGDYTPDNMVPMSAAAWYGFSGYLHEQIKELPDGTHVQLVVE